MASKKCFKCGGVFDLTMFYKHSAMADGHVNKCKTCNKKDVIVNRGDKVEYYRKYDRERGNRQSPEYLKQYRADYPRKYKAHCLVNNAVRDRRLIPETICSNKGCNTTQSIVGHHDDYLEPLVIRWLCQACHIQWHKTNGEGKNG
jgi:hypothetical protein